MLCWTTCICVHARLCTVVIDWMTGKITWWFDFLAMHQKIDDDDNNYNVDNDYDYDDGDNDNNDEDANEDDHDEDDNNDVDNDDEVKPQNTDYKITSNVVNYI